MGLSVNTILSIALVVMFIIAAALIIGLLFPYVGTKGGCPGAQRLHIEEINSTVEDAKTYGITYILKFRVEDCVECMWYDDSLQSLRIRWVGMSTTDEAVIIGVSVPWNCIGENDPVDDDLSCSDVSGENIKGGTACVLEINYNRVTNIDVCPS